MLDVLHCTEEELEEGSFEDNGAQLIGAIHFQELPSLIEILAKMIRIVNILTMMMMVGIMKMMRRWRKRKTMMMRMRMKMMIRRRTKKMIMMIKEMESWKTVSAIYVDVEDNR